MSHYFYDMIPAEELAQLHYLPTVPEYLDRIVSKWADRPALSDTVNTYTYAQMGSRIARRRTLLKEAGLQAGDHVAILDKNSIDAVENFLAVTSAGMVAILLPAQLPAPAVIGCCAKFRAKALIVRDEFREGVQGAPCPLLSASALGDDLAELLEENRRAVEIDLEDRRDRRLRRRDARRIDKIPYRAELLRMLNKRAYRFAACEVRLRCACLEARVPKDL